MLYCNPSREATLTFMVMKYILGYDDVRLYEGSWTEYNTRMEMPSLKGQVRDRS